MSDKGEWIDEWEDAEEPCPVCDTTMRCRTFRRYRDNNESVLFKCFNCEENYWVDA